MMKKYIFSLLIIISCSVSAQDLKTYFVSMPDSIIPLLTKINREDCIDFIDSKMKAEVKNKFGKPSELKKITANYLFLQTTPNSYVEMKLLGVNDSTKIIGVVKTYKAKTYDSDIAFYSTDWKRLSNKYITLPSKGDFIKSDSISSSDLPIQEINDIMDFPLRKISFYEDSDDITIENMAPKTLAKEQQDGLSSAKGDNTLRYNWTDGRFVLRR